MRNDHERTEDGGKPDWYAEAGEGPFGRQAPGLEDMAAVEKRIADRASRRRRRNRLIASASAMAILAVLASTLLIRGAWPPAAPLSSENAEPTADPDIVRAIGETDGGRIIVTPDASVPEKREALGAASCYGVDTDVRTEGSYKAIYETDESREVIASLPDLSFIQPSEEPAPMLRLTFPDADVFLLVPQYRDCHALTFYAFAVEKNGGAAYPLAFVTADGTLDNSYYMPGDEPEIRDGRLVLSTTEGPGGETPEGGQARLFRLDLASRTFIQAAASGNAEEILGQTADGTVAVLADSPKKDGSYQGLTVRTPNGSASFPWTSVSSYEPVVRLADANRDGRDEIVVILTTGTGTELHMEELHVLDASTLAELPAEDAAEAVQSKVVSSIEKRNGSVRVTAEANGEKIEKTYDEADATFWNDEIGYGAIVYYRVLDDGTLGATLFGRVSITEFPVKVEVRYGADLKVEVVGLSENA
ncbi:hypothetical protein [Cohnella cellulosilytica]|uniref:VCBS repeat-containing protein n=1 Tax=Cohnella cellulosilytica TaxID=986710 RepID=A0ABW2FGV3_9BACL